LHQFLIASKGPTRGLRFFPKIARYSREVIVTKKIDGANGCIGIGADGTFKVGSRNGWLDAATGDNMGFGLWAHTHKDELMQLGPGRHFGEWWGSGIQRGYGLPTGEKRFSLFNVARWQSNRPAYCDVVPMIGRWDGLDALDVREVMAELWRSGSKAAPGFMRPEGIVIFHTEGNVGFKKTFEKDAGKGGRSVAPETRRAARPNLRGSVEG
jgi:hypothetical protein